MIERLTVSRGGSIAEELLDGLGAIGPETRAVIIGGALDGEIDPAPAAAHDGVRSIALVESLAVPVVLEVHGRCTGLGLDLVLAVDVIVADPGSTFGPASTVGGFLARHQSWIHGRDVAAMLIAGVELTAERAYRHLLVDEVHDPVDARSLEIARRLAGAAPRSMEIARRILHRSAESDLAELHRSIDAVASGPPRSVDGER